MKSVLSYMTQKNTVTFLILLFVGVGLFKVANGTIALQNLVSLLDVQVAALAAGAGLASIKFTKATAGEPILGIAVILVLAYALIGAVQVVTTSLTFEAYLKLMELPVAGLAIGKGLFANNAKATT